MPGDLADWAAVAVRLLYERGARRVWAYGSYGEGRRLDPNSDIDLAVEGLTPASINAVAAQLRGRCPYKLDIVPMEEAPAQVRWFIRRGRLV
jgi:predicted nucleotidyltransferase